jgi:hypothetical protein
MLYGMSDKNDAESLITAHPLWSHPHRMTCLKPIADRVAVVTVGPPSDERTVLVFRCASCETVNVSWLEGEKLYALAGENTPPEVLLRTVAYAIGWRDGRAYGTARVQITAQAQAAEAQPGQTA